MPHSTVWTRLLISLSVLLPTISANFMIDDKLSFGTDGQIHLINNAIPKWNFFGEGHAPQLLSDRLILTPPAPGNTRAALWSDDPTANKHWLAEVNFRASGQDRGTGNFQIWFAKDGHTQIGLNSIYSVAKFQGLAIVIDQHGGHGGMLRAFLNDGSGDYKAKGDAVVDGLAFGHCAFAYRNLGAPSKITIVNDANGFRVDVDDHQCFYSEKVNLPAGYRFGMTASSAENPDSIEVSRFVVSFATSDADKAPPANNDHTQQQEQHHEQPIQNKDQSQQQQHSISSSDYQKLIERIEMREAQINRLEHELQLVKDDALAYHKEMRESATGISKQILKLDSLLTSTSSNMRVMNEMVEKIERIISNSDYLNHVKNIHTAIESVRGGLNDALPDTLHQSEFFPFPSLAL